MTQSQTRPALEVVSDSSLDRSFSDELNLHAAGPFSWEPRLVTQEKITWLRDRWDASTQTLTWKDTDRVSMPRMHRDRSVHLEDLHPNARAEVLISAASDFVDGNSGTPSAARGVVRAATEGRARSIHHLDDAALAKLVGVCRRRWTTRLTLASADPEAEWDRDEVRLIVIKPDADRAIVFKLGQISQPWLRDVVTKTLKLHVHNTSSRTTQQWIAAAIRLSAFLATRPDGGNRPTVLGAAAMTDFANALQADSEVTDEMVKYTLRNISAVLTRARAMGYTDPYGLSTAFRVLTQHYPAETQVVGEERGFPEATFRFLLGADDLLGSRVLDLGRSLAVDDFHGRMYITALQLAANFGRRPEELCALPADRVRIADTGMPELLYDNFKSGRDKVWLPIDARAAEIVGEWVTLLRLQYPNTALSDLAMFPRTKQNETGTQSLKGETLAIWFRGFVGLLEQAILLGHIHAKIGVDIASLCQLHVRDLSAGGLTVDGTQHDLPDSLLGFLVDYRKDVVTRYGLSKHAPANPDDLPLFPDPRVRFGGQSDRFRPIAAVAAGRFSALGDGWEEIAAQYACGGIPGRSLGQRRISSDELQIRLFRHTYLQHLVNIGTDIFLVAELADHGNVQTTINAYVRVQEEKLREAVERLGEHRVNIFGQSVTRAAPLLSLPLKDVGTNDCANPQVLNLGKEGCDRDRMCFDCGFFTADPSHIPDIQAEIQTCNLTLARLDAQEDSDFKVHHIAVLRARRRGWQEKRAVLRDYMDSLDPAERERVDTAAIIVREFRNRMRSGGINFGAGGPA